LTKVKICGLRKVEEALEAAKAGADFLGLVFAPSPRFISPEEARRVILEVREHFPQKPAFVGVFVNPSPAEVNSIANFCSLDLVQLNGEEPPSFLRQITKPKIKSIPLKGEVSALLNLIDAYIKERAIILLDSYVKGEYGGTGRTGNWDLAACLAQKVPIILAGGLEPQNVATAITKVSPWGVDVSSGVERVRGVKEPAKIRAFIEEVRRIDEILSR